nr:immunoglobulin light chain junction region [Macaca mulatta]MOY05010.1 immunoglobulin light chain junction region [Macaca mulatta]MOY05269.1 immunoglobulin light chain junction region [Macaca mulatta]MOY05708.1 immunoglobulin light chain junction region [Macaca mulatta]MOY05814.1 immunoglobulin light chain junction region [Macaca mulatta]
DYYCTLYMGTGIDVF